MAALDLEEAVRRMAAAQLDRTLTDQQVDLLVGFLRTLTGIIADLLSSEPHHED